MTKDTSEPFGNLRNDSETFGNVPNDAEAFRTLPHAKEKTEHHTVSVREVARRFEDSGVARTERSIINWCTPNKQGLSRLDCYYDPNERRYFITPQSVERAIEEELAKAIATGKLANNAEDFGNTQQSSENKEARTEAAGGTESENEQDAQLKTLTDELFNLKVDKAAKDQFVTLLKDQITADREQFKEFVAQIAESARKIGELETKLLQLEAPQPRRPDAGAVSSVTYDLRPADSIPEDSPREPVSVHVVDASSATLP
jgi:hypothetical protein